MHFLYFARKWLNLEKLYCISVHTFGSLHLQSTNTRFTLKQPTVVDHYHSPMYIVKACIKEADRKRNRGGMSIRNEVILKQWYWLSISRWEESWAVWCWLTKTLDRPQHIQQQQQRQSAARILITLWYGFQLWSKILSCLTFYLHVGPSVRPATH